MHKSVSLITEQLYMKQTFVLTLLFISKLVSKHISSKRLQLRGSQ